MLLLTSASLRASQTESEEAALLTETSGPCGESESGRPESGPPESGPAETIPTVQEPETGETENKGQESEVKDQESDEKNQESDEKDQEQPVREENWKLVVDEIGPDLPEGGRVYDGTDQIRLKVCWHLEADQADGPLQDEKRPGVQVTCQARLDSPHAGLRRILYSLQLQTDQPDHVRLAEETGLPKLEVLVQRRPLSVQIPDGVKIYGAEAGPDSIWPADRADELEAARGPSRTWKLGEGRIAARVSGFLTGPDGNALVPEGFRNPEVAVDPKVLTQTSPMYQEGKEAVYENALVMKRKADGSLTGNPTADYIFCEDPTQPSYQPGAVRILPGLIEEERDFQVTGRDLVRTDRGWVAGTGTKIQIRPTETSGYNQGYEKKLTEDGKLTFTLQRRNKKGDLLAESLPAQVDVEADGEVPKVAIQVAGGTSQEGMIFSREGVDLRLIPQMDPVSGLESVCYRVREGEGPGAAFGDGKSLDQAGEGWISFSPEAGQSLHLDREGVWQVEAIARDRVGNRAMAASSLIVIDRQKPKCMIEGADDQSANSGQVLLRFSCTDPWYRKGSARISISADVGGQTPKVETREETEDGVRIVMEDFPYDRTADGFYHVRIEAEDLAGNKGESQIAFSVNRYGSTYGISSETYEEIRTYYHRTPFEVTFLETNLDQVESPQILVMKDGRRRKGIQAVQEEKADMDADGMRHYCYRISKDQFRESGRYEVILMTKDRAGNRADSQAQNLPVRFAIDGEKPQCLVSGLKQGGTYQGTDRTVTFEVRDNLDLKSAEVYLDAKKTATYSEGEIRKQGGVFKILLSEKEAWQRLQIHAEDRAGNECWTEEFPFYLSPSDRVPQAEGFGKSAKVLQEEKEESQIRKGQGHEKGAGAGSAQEGSVWIREGGSYGSGRLAQEERDPVGRERTTGGRLALRQALYPLLAFCALCAVHWMRKGRLSRKGSGPAGRRGRK